MATVYVVKTTDYDGTPVEGVFDQLQLRNARFGWSYQDDLDLRIIRRIKEQGEEFNADQSEAKRCLRFYTDVRLEDYLLYPNQPERGQFCVVRVTGCYDYSDAAESLEGDFRSYRHCELKFPCPIDMYDEIVPSILRFQMGYPGRFYQVHDTVPFYSFLANIENAGKSQDGSNRVRLMRIYAGLWKKIPRAIYVEFSRAELSRRFCTDLFERMGFSSVVVQEGPYEAGSDVIVTIGNPLLTREYTVGVQVFAYTGNIKVEDLKNKLDQLLAGWEKNDLDHGVLLTTGHCTSEAKEALAEHNKKNNKNQVRLVEGDDLADLFLRYFSPDSI